MITLQYKGYNSTAYIDDESIWCGNVYLFGNLIHYEAANEDSIRESFKEAVDDYIQTCIDLNG